MAKQIVDIGTTPNDNTGDTIRAGFDKMNQNINQLFDAAAVTTTVTFKTIAGTWVNSPTTPITSTIPLSTTDAVNGGVAAVYYKGPLLTKNSFSGGTVVIFSGANIVDELCVVYIIYDKLNNAFHVNIHAGATGDIPGSPTGTPATPIIESIEDESGGDSTAPATPIIESIEDESGGDSTAPATPIIESIEGYTTFDIASSSAASSTLACAGALPATNLVMHNGVSAVPAVGDIIRVIATGLFFVGSGLWWKVAGFAIRVSATGEVLDKTSC